MGWFSWIRQPLNPRTSFPPFPQPQELEQGSFPLKEKHVSGWCFGVDSWMNPRPRPQTWELSLSKKTTTAMKPLVFEGWYCSWRGRLTSHYSFRYGILLLRFRIERYENLNERNGRFSIFHLRGKADVMEQKPSGKIWNQHTLLGVSATSWWWKNWKKVKTAQKHLMDHPKYFSFWWISRIGKVYCCNLL